MSSFLFWLSDSFSWLTIPTVSITLTDIVEILILAFLVYNLLLWIQNTRAWNLLKGIAILAACIAIVYLFQMTTLMYLVNRVVDIAITAAVVVFHPEIRRALERLGEKSVFSGLLQFGDENKNGADWFGEKTINEIVKASTEMSKVKTGALIVVEQNTRLEEYERTGIMLDSLVTSQLLINIFEHNTPLHDGAVIIKGNRITAATCYLPLSDNMMLNKALGTRHRAGLGISEETDSMTVIVSEETGAISVAYQGELMHGISAEELRKYLTQLQKENVAPKKIRQYLKDFVKGWTKNEA
ncbi:MAG: diadenylate cyclase CdaA [Lachnospiraceae bacterium]|nr:diadenylate cyclase CdaA [Lachnospiraceae bacterium]MCD7956545.1 diadenylate cyclase CdaA [Lachnospiraceae bacterium]